MATPLGFDRRLTWDDFRKVAVSPHPKRYDAQTGVAVNWSSKVSYGPKGSWKTTKVKVEVLLVSRETWVVKGKESVDLLSHEQGHYDIYAIAARTLQTRLESLSGDRSQSFNKTSDAIVRSIIGKATRRTGRHKGIIVQEGLVQEIDHAYDEGIVTGTNHGQAKTNQSVWKHNIDNAHLSPEGTLGDLLMFFPGDFPVQRQDFG